MRNAPSTTGDLRMMLMEAIENVRSGKIEAQKATAIVKLAGQINMSLLAEAQLTKLAFTANKQVYTVGNMPLEGGAIIKALES